MVCAQVAVAALVEMRADDVAAARVAPAELSTALRTVGGSAPAAALSSFAARSTAGSTGSPARRAPLPRPLWALVRLAAVALAAAPAAAVLLP